MWHSGECAAYFFGVLLNLSYIFRGAFWPVGSRFGQASSKDWNELIIQTENSSYKEKSKKTIV